MSFDVIMPEADSSDEKRKESVRKWVWKRRTVWSRILWMEMAISNPLHLFLPNSLPLQKQGAPCHFLVPSYLVLFGGFLWYRGVPTVCSSTYACLYICWDPQEASSKDTGKWDVSHLLPTFFLFHILTISEVEMYSEVACYLATSCLINPAMV